MLFTKTEIDGAWLISPQPSLDERGFFARTFCVREFGERGLEDQFVQHSVSFNGRRGTLRGLHMQLPPFQEVKIVGCVKGAMYDVIVDLRPSSPTFLHWQSFELSAANRRQLYIPRGVAHGFQTMVDATEVSYLISEYFTPTAAIGYPYDDPAFGISWPMPITAISERDRSWPAFARSRLSA